MTGCPCEPWGDKAGAPAKQHGPQRTQGEWRCKVSLAGVAAFDCFALKQNGLAGVPELNNIPPTAITAKGEALLRPAARGILNNIPPTAVTAKGAALLRPATLGAWRPAALGALRSAALGAWRPATRRPAFSRLSASLRLCVKSCTAADEMQRLDQAIGSKLVTKSSCTLTKSSEKVAQSSCALTKSQEKVVKSSRALTISSMVVMKIV